jgi:hypothetical protein
LAGQIHDFVESADGFAEVTPENVGIKPWAQLGRRFDIARQLEIPGSGNVAKSGASDRNDR